MHLVGHDWGAIISWYYILKPERLKKIKSLTTISCPNPSVARENLVEAFSSFDISNIGQAMGQVSKSWYAIFFQIPFMPEFVLDNFGEAVWKYAMSRAELPENDPMLTYGPEKIRKISKNTINLYRQLAIELPSSIPEKKISIPVQMIIPKQDLAIEPFIYDNTEKHVEKLTVSKLDGNHWIHRQHPQKVNKLIKEFISSD